ncbi:aspartate/glutamate racemase family protein [Gottfriedia sp. NPDC057991]|uniref:aspartate/glutamate racemase family protein n=1 Tax=Gottfriedia sp. NPDC057991 TaxID=3346298 RepID=UPI0036DE5470
MPITKRILWINPVATNIYDQIFKDELESIKDKNTIVDVISFEAPNGPTHLEYNCYEAMMIPNIVNAVMKAEQDGYDAAVIGCFYDPALRAAREVAKKMVVTAPAEASLHIAATLGESISIIVGRKKWIPEMKENVFKYGFGHKLASFQSVELGVHDFQKDHNVTANRILEAAREAITRDHADVIVLGCTLEFGFYKKIQEELGVPVIDASVAPFKYAEFLVELNQRFNWRHSKIMGYQSPPEDEVNECRIFDQEIFIK